MASNVLFKPPIECQRSDSMNPIVKLLQDILAQIKLLRKDLKK